MDNTTITFVRGDDTDFLDQILIVVAYITNINLEGYKTRFTIENSHNFMRQFEVQNNTSQIILDKTITSTLEVGTHKCNIKLIDTLGRINTVHNFEIEVKDEFNIDGFKYPNEYELEITVNDGINKYKNYNELIDETKPLIQGVMLEGDKSFQDLGIDRFAIGISNEGIKRHNEDNMSHFDIRDELRNKQDRLIAGSNITIIDGIISSLGAEGGITTDYKDLGNKPKINGKVLDEDVTLDELGIQPKGEYVTEEILDQKGYLVDVPSGYVTEEELEQEGFLKEVPEEYFTDEQNEQKYAKIEDLDIKQNKILAGENINISINEEDKTETISAVIPEEYVTEEELDAKDFVNNTDLTRKLNKKQNIMYSGNNIRFQHNTDGSITISAIDSKNPKDIVSYNDLDNKPSIGGKMLIGNKSLEELGVQPKGEYQHTLSVGDNIEIEDNVISAIIPDYLCTDDELQYALTFKADWGTTLMDYKINDAYTKEQIDNIIRTNNKENISDVIIDAPNGIVSYTEGYIRLKQGLKVLFSDGKNLNGTYRNKEVLFENDITLHKDAMGYDINEKEFYVVATCSGDNNLGLSVIPKSKIKMFNGEKIPNTFTNYIKHISNNKYYYMEIGEHGINTPRQVYIKVIAEGTINKLSEEQFEIASLSPYGIHRIVIQDELLQSLQKYQEKLKFGRNFIVNNNVVDYLIPYNYVTKEYLIENNYATQTNINDAINTHNISDTSHEDIRELIRDRYSYLYSYVDSRCDALSRRIDELQRTVNEILNRLNMR